MKLFLHFRLATTLVIQCRFSEQKMPVSSMCTPWKPQAYRVSSKVLAALNAAIGIPHLGQAIHVLERPFRYALVMGYLQSLHELATLLENDEM